MKQLIKIKDGDEKNLLNSVEKLNKTLVNSGLPGIVFIRCGAIDFTDEKNRRECSSVSGSLYAIDISDNILKTDFKKVFCCIFPSYISIGEDSIEKPISETMFSDSKLSFEFAVGIASYFTKNFSLWEKRTAESFSGTSGKIRKFVNSLSENSCTDIFNEIKKSIGDEYDRINGIIRDYWGKQHSNNDFTVSVKEVLSEDKIPFNRMGIFSYAVYGAMQEYKKATSPMSIESDYVGQIKERMTKVLIPIKSKAFSSYSAYTRNMVDGTRFTFKDDAGNEYFSFCSSAKIIKTLTRAMNTPVKMKFTIVSHEVVSNKKTNKINYIAIDK